MTCQLVTSQFFIISHACSGPIGKSVSILCYPGIFLIKYDHVRPQAFANFQLDRKLRSIWPQPNDV